MSEGEVERMIVQHLKSVYAVRSPVIAEAVGTNIEQTRLVLAELSRRGIVKRSRSGRYRLVESS